MYHIQIWTMFQASIVLRFLTTTKYQKSFEDK